VQANEARIDLDGPRPSAELVPPQSGAKRGRARRLCHVRAIPSTTPPVCHGQPRTLPILWPAAALLEVCGNTNGKDGVPEGTAGPHRATIDRIAADNTGHYRADNCPAHW